MLTDGNGKVSLAISDCISSTSRNISSPAEHRNCSICQICSWSWFIETLPGVVAQSASCKMLYLSASALRYCARNVTTAGLLSMISGITSSGATEWLPSLLLWLCSRSEMEPYAWSHGQCWFHIWRIHISVIRIFTEVQIIRYESTNIIK